MEWAQGPRAKAWEGREWAHERDQLGTGAGMGRNG